MTDQTKPDAKRHSTKNTVALAQRVMRRTDPKNPEKGLTTEWLIRAARSLAGSVISQADPND